MYVCSKTLSAHVCTPARRMSSILLPTVEAAAELPALNSPVTEPSAHMSSWDSQDGRQPMDSLEAPAEPPPAHVGQTHLFGKLNLSRTPLWFHRLNLNKATIHLD